MSIRAAIILLVLGLSAFQARAINVLVERTLFFIPEKGGYSPYLETSWEIDATTLNFTQQGAGWISKTTVELSISGDTGRIKEDRFILQTPPIADKAAAKRQLILDLHRYTIPYGKVKIEISFSDGFTTPFKYTDTFTVAPPEGAFASSPQLLDTAYRSETQSPFLRNGMQHIPLNFAFIDDNRQALNYYFELYGLDKYKDDQPLVLKTFISKKRNENVLPDYIRTDTLQPSAVIPKYGSYNVGSLPSGNYYLNTTVFSNSGKRLASAYKYFQRANKQPAKPDVAATDTADKPDIFDTSKVNFVVFNINKTFTAKYNHAQLKAILKMLLPVATPAEQQNINGFLKNPDELYSRYFIYNFWLNRDPEKPEKEWEKYADRVREVNRMFGSDYKPGYETDRGYIYLKYGKPTERIIVTNEQSALPYEVWQYFQVSTQGKDGLFLFYKPANEIADYRLLHSTVTGEAKDLNWRNSLYPNGKTGMMDSQAEVHLRNR